MKKLLILTLAALGACATLTAGEDAKLKKVIAGDHRSEQNSARDTYRHPYETLQFFGVKDDMTVIEVFPGGGWYTEILGPYLKDNGKLIAAIYDTNPETQRSWMARVNKAFTDKVDGKADTYGKITAIGMPLPGGAELAPAGSVDMVLDFRNAHNWHQMSADDMVKSWSKALKKGGVVGIVDHRMDAEKEYNPRSGYIHEKTIIETMEKHGFKLAGKTDINANAKDTKDHPRGVWSLPPTLSKPDDATEEDTARFKKIGESDRFTLKFVKQ